MCHAFPSICSMLCHCSQIGAALTKFLALRTEGTKGFTLRFLPISESKGLCFLQQLTLPTQARGPRCLLRGRKAQLKHLKGGCLCLQPEAQFDFCPRLVIHPILPFQVTHCPTTAPDCCVNLVRLEFSVPSSPLSNAWELG